MLSLSLGTIGCDEGGTREVSHDAIRDVVARLGLADVRTCELTWEDCETILKRLGYDIRIEIVAARWQSEDAEI